MPLLSSTTIPKGIPWRTFSDRCGWSVYLCYVLCLVVFWMAEASLLLFVWLFTHKMKDIFFRGLSLFLTLASRFQGSGIFICCGGYNEKDTTKNWCEQKSINWWNSDFSIAEVWQGSSMNNAIAVSSSSGTRNTKVVVLESSRRRGNKKTPS